jgi:hypothetical protein
MKTFITTYKMQLLISITLFVTIVALAVLKEPLEIGLVFFGCILGTFILDLDYLIYAHFMEPHKNFSKTLLTFIKHKDFSNALNYISFNKTDVKDKTLHSALFQVILALFSIFVVSSNVTYLIKALVLSILCNSIYKLIEAHYANQVDDWFWAFKATPNKKSTLTYGTIIFSIFIYCLTLI